MAERDGCREKNDVSEPDWDTEPCSDCQGRGCTADMVACSTCLGTGKLPRHVTDSGEEAESVTLPRHEFDQLLAVATMYANAFEPDELMTLPAKLMLQDVEAILERYGRRY